MKLNNNHFIVYDNLVIETCSAEDHNLVTAFLERYKEYFAYTECISSGIETFEEIFFEEIKTHFPEIVLKIHQNVKYVEKAVVKW